MPNLLVFQFWTSFWQRDDATRKQSEAKQNSIASNTKNETKAKKKFPQLKTAAIRRIFGC